MRVSKAWVLHFYAVLAVFANAHGGADYVGGSRPEASHLHQLKNKIYLF
jgi:hypothetical protein